MYNLDFYFMVRVTNFIFPLSFFSLYPFIFVYLKIFDNINKSENFENVMFSSWFLFLFFLLLWGEQFIICVCLFCFVLFFVLFFCFYLFFCFLFYLWEWLNDSEIFFFFLRDKDFHWIEENSPIRQFSWLPYRIIKSFIRHSNEFQEQN